MDVSTEQAYPTPVSNSSLLPLLLLSLAHMKNTPNSADNIKDEYDYIIVGGGSAGSVVASRLSEEPCVDVLLLEAGHEPPLLTEVPGLCTYFSRTDVDWQFKTVPQRHGATALLNRQVHLTLGKMLGGSGNLNYMAYVRGNRKNYDDWAAGGAKGWSYDEVLPYFFKLEDFRVIKDLYNGYHASGGPITVEEPRYTSALKQATYVTAQRLGYRFVDSNAKMQTGFFDAYMNIRNGQRCSSVKGYLVPSENRTNLDILLNAMVTRIIIEDNVVKGVEFHHEGQLKVIKARREVIVSAGSVNTPKILMLSGVGPKQQLQELNIPVVANLPVGKNFHDQSSTPYLFTLDPFIPSREEELSDSSNILQYIGSRTGPLVSGGFLYLAFLKGPNAAPRIDFPNFELDVGAVIPKPLDSIPATPEVQKKFIFPNRNKTLFQCFSANLQPRSRGTVTLKSADPFDPPLIDPNYFQVASDVEDIVDGLRVCKRLLDTEPLKSLGAKPLETPLPGCEEYDLYDDDYLRCYARALFNSYSHFVGSCKMGDPEDPTTVVNPELRVKNVKGLRVVDASVMPMVTSGNTNIPTMMIAEKASDMIRKSIAC